MLRSILLASAVTLALGGCVVENGVSQYEANYTGSYSGSDFGDLTLRVAANGDVTLDATSKLTTIGYHGTGSIDKNGHGSASTGSGFGGLVSFSFAGTFSYGSPTKANGTWTSSNGGSGSWNATRQQ
jgi:hypothetical protein